MTEKDEPRVENMENNAKIRDKGEKRERHRKKSAVFALNRIVVRRLPPMMTEVEFLEQTSPLPEHENFKFVGADWSLGAMAYSRAYLSIKQQEDLFSFRERFDGYVFVDAKGNEHPAVVEFAPFQGFPKMNKGKALKRDPKIGTIENEQHYLAFLEKLKANAEAKPVEGKLEYSYKIKEEAEITSTPLLEFLSSKKAEKLAEKKRKMDEKRKRRDEDRQKKKLQVAKSFPEAINEEKGVEKENTSEKKGDMDENGIMVRIVPSRLDRNQRQKGKEEKREAKKERDRERNRERKEKRQEIAKEKRIQRAKEATKSETSNKDEEKPQDNANQESQTAKDKVQTKDGQETKKSREVKKYSERRKEIRERAEQRRQAEEKDSETKPENSSPAQEAPEFDEEKSCTDSAEERAKRIRNKDRPAMAIYQPRRGRLAANFDGDRDEEREGKRRDRRSGRHRGDKKEKEEKKGTADVIAEIEEKPQNEN